MTQRHSKKREAILAAIKNAPGAVSAASLHRELPHLDRATIYRNLERFVADGTVKKLHLDSSNEAQFEYQSEPHHHAVCRDCAHVIHFHAPEEKLKAALNLADFAIDEIEVTVRGHCTAHEKPSGRAPA
jgi:Fe2+ or Zn2+ uptake regulation protein